MTVNNEVAGPITEFAVQVAGGVNRATMILKLGDQQKSVLPRYARAQLIVGCHSDSETTSQVKIQAGRQQKIGLRKQLSLERRRSQLD